MLVPNREERCANIPLGIGRDSSALGGRVRVDASAVLAEDALL
jgi:hypothetical protein